MALTTTADRECKAHTTCNFDLEFEDATVTPDASTDRRCVPLIECDADTQYAYIAATPTSQRYCTGFAALPCVLYASYESTSRTASTDRVCSPVDMCTSINTQYVGAFPTLYVDTVCTDFTPCNTGCDPDNSEDTNCSGDRVIADPASKDSTKFQGTTSDPIIDFVWTADRACNVRPTCNPVWETASAKTAKATDCKEKPYSTMLRTFSWDNVPVDSGGGLQDFMDHPVLNWESDFMAKINNAGDSYYSNSTNFNTVISPNLHNVSQGTHTFAIRPYNWNDGARSNTKGWQVDESGNFVAGTDCTGICTFVLEFNFVVTPVSTGGGSRQRRKALLRSNQIRQRSRRAINLSGGTTSAVPEGQAQCASSDSSYEGQTCCEAGYYSSSTNACIACDAGYYSAAESLKSTTFASASDGCTQQPVCTTGTFYVINPSEMSLTQPVPSSNCLAVKSCNQEERLELTAPTANDDRVCGDAIELCNSDASAGALEQWTNPEDDAFASLEWTAQPSCATFAVDCTNIGDNYWANPIPPTRFLGNGLKPVYLADRDCVARDACNVASQYTSNAALLVSPATNNVYNRECANLTICDTSTQYESSPKTEDTDRGCSPSPNCNAAIEFERAPATVNSGRQCQLISSCDYDLQYENASATSTTDRDCQNLEECTSNIEWESEQPTWDSDRVCTPISSACTSVEYQAAAPTETSDRDCQELPRCSDGFPAASCDSGFQLDVTPNTTHCNQNPCTSSECCVQPATTVGCAPSCATSVSLWTTKCGYVGVCDQCAQCSGSTPTAAPTPTPTGTAGTINTTTTDTLAIGDTDIPVDDVAGISPGDIFTIGNETSTVIDVTAGYVTVASALVYGYSTAEPVTFTTPSIQCGEGQYRGPAVGVKPVTELGTPNKHGPIIHNVQGKAACANLCNFMAPVPCVAFWYRSAEDKCQLYRSYDDQATVMRPAAATSEFYYVDGAGCPAGADLCDCNVCTESSLFRAKGGKSPNSADDDFTGETTNIVQLMLQYRGENCIGQECNMQQDASCSSYSNLVYSDVSTVDKMSAEGGWKSLKVKVKGEDAGHSSHEVTFGSTFTLINPGATVQIELADGKSKISKTSLSASCACPLQVGDRFGPFEVVEFLNQAFGSRESCATTCTAATQAPTPTPITLPPMQTPTPAPSPLGVYDCVDSNYRGAVVGYKPIDNATPPNRLGAVAANIYNRDECSNLCTSSATDCVAFWYRSNLNPNLAECQLYRSYESSAELALTSQDTEFYWLDEAACSGCKCNVCSTEPVALVLGKKGKPIGGNADTVVTLTLKYRGQPCKGDSCNEQTTPEQYEFKEGWALTNTEIANGPALNILVKGQKLKHHGHTGKVNNIRMGDLFVVSLISDEVTITLKQSSGLIVSRTRFDASCVGSLMVGNLFGPFEVVDFQNAAGGKLSDCSTECATEIAALSLSIQNMAVPFSSCSSLNPLLFNIGQ